MLSMNSTKGFPTSELDSPLSYKTFLKIWNEHICGIVKVAITGGKTGWNPLWWIMWWWLCLEKIKNKKKKEDKREGEEHANSLKHNSTQ